MSDNQPDASFDAFTANLEDVYFCWDHLTDGQYFSIIV
jgi:hypothetical protein